MLLSTPLDLSSYQRYFYLFNFAIFALGNCYLIYRLYRKANRDASEVTTILETDGEDKDVEDEEDEEYELEFGRGPAARGAVSKATIWKFRFEFFLPYALAVAADWLQGPHLFAIYKYEKQIPEKLVAALYATGCICGAISALFAGDYADRLGRKRSCILYCILAFIACGTMVSNNMTILFFGRACGGVCATLLFSVFETWMISAYHEKKMKQHGLELSTMFGHMTTLSGVVAIASGVIGDILVENLGGRIWPFITAEVCSVLTGICIWQLWTENYGAATSRGFSLASLQSGLLTIAQDSKILVLTITSCFFEGMSLLFVYFWSAALKSARSASGSQDELPFGVIFSSFMCALMAGSAFYTLQSSTHSAQSAMWALLSAILIASCCLSLTVVLRDERFIFWLFCITEGCIGAFYPSIATLKSEAIKDGVRGRVYSIMRMPLDVFVVVVHSLDQEGDAHRNLVFLTCSALLVFTSVVLRRQFASA